HRLGIRRRRLSRRGPNRPRRHHPARWHHPSFVASVRHRLHLERVRCQPGSLPALRERIRRSAGNACSPGRAHSHRRTDDNVSAADVIAAWDQPSARAAIHPTRGISEDAYRESGRSQAEALATDLPDGAKVMDFGCGDGRVAIPLRALGYDVTGVDSSPRMLALLAERDPGMRTFQSDGSDLSKRLGRRKMDAVYCLAVLIHHSYTDCLHSIGRLRAATKHGGLLILDWPVSDQPSEAGAWIGVTTWSRQQQTEACARIGLEPVDSELPWGVYRAVKTSS